MAGRLKDRSPARRRSERGEVKPICGHPLKRGGLCKRPPGLGTDHPGVGCCSQHGGNKPGELRKVLRSVTLSSGVDESVLWSSPPMGIAIDMEPIDALTWCVKLAAGEVAYLTMRLQEVDHEDVIVRKQTDSREVGEGEKGHKDLRKRELGEWTLDILITERQRAIDRLARLSKMALDAGVAERTVQLAEREGEMLVAVIERVVEKLSLTAKQMNQLEAVLPTILLEMENGQQVVTR